MSNPPFLPQGGFLAGLQQLLAQRSTMRQRINGYPNAGQDLFTAAPGASVRPQSPPYRPPAAVNAEAPQSGAFMSAEANQLPGLNAQAAAAPDFPTHGGPENFGPQQDLTQKRQPFLQRMLDSIVGVPNDPSLTRDEQGAMRHAGLLSMSSALLRGPQPGQANNVLSMIGGAMPAAQEASMGALTQRDALQSRAQAQQVRGLLSQLGPGGATPDNMRRMMGVLMMSGNVQGAKEMAEAMHAMQPTLHFSDYQGATRVFDGEGRQINTEGVDDGNAAVVPDNVRQPLEGVYQRFGKDTDDLQGKAVAQQELQSTGQALLNPGTPPQQRGALATQLVFAFVRSMVAGAGRMTQAEISQSINSGSLPQSFMNVINKIIGGTYDAEFIRGVMRAARTAGHDQMRQFDRYRNDYTQQSQAMNIPGHYLKFPDPWSGLRADSAFNQNDTPTPRPHPAPRGRSNVGR